MKAIGIDLGGTRIKAALLNAEGNILHQQYMATGDGDDNHWKEMVATLVRDIKTKIKNEACIIGISAPGLPDDKNRCISCMPVRMKGLENFLWTDYLQNPVYVMNDAIAAMMAEAKFGAAKNKKNVVMLTLGTGVGGAILINGQPYQGAFGKAGHIGHMVINDDGEPDICGMPGSLEDAIGNATILKRSNGKFSSTWDLLKAYCDGDDSAKRIWLTSLKKLAIGLASVINILSPEMIVLGGGISEAGDSLFQPLTEFMHQYEWRPGGNKTTIVKAQHGDQAGAIGAAAFAIEIFENNRKEK